MLLPNKIVATPRVLRHEGLISDASFGLQAALVEVVPDGGDVLYFLCRVRRLCSRNDIFSGSRGLAVISESHVAKCASRRCLFCCLADFTLIANRACLSVASGSKPNLVGTHVTMLEAKPKASGSVGSSTDVAGGSGLVVDRPFLSIILPADPDELASSSFCVREDGLTCPQVHQCSGGL